MRAQVATFAGWLIPSQIGRSHATKKIISHALQYLGDPIFSEYLRGSYQTHIEIIHTSL
jgi:23S rRNA maturation mini-RNase III